MRTKAGVVTFGEALIDFIPTDQSHTIYLKSPGGAPANVAVGVARLDGQSTFIGMVGQDHLGNFLINTLKDAGVCTGEMFQTSESSTGASIVTTGQDGERSFDFLNQQSADWLLTVDHLNEKVFQSQKIFHFGSISLIDDPIQTTLLQALLYAQKHKMIISFDPNIRLALWTTPNNARKAVRSVLTHIDVLKVSTEELALITQESTIQTGVQALKNYKIPFIIVTCGSEGSYVFIKEQQAFIPAMDVKAVDTTGAGDAFVSGILYCLDLYDGSPYELSLKDAKEFARFASVSGGLTVAGKGAMSALPTLPDVQRHLRNI